MMCIVGFAQTNHGDMIHTNYQPGTPDSILDPFMNSGQTWGYLYIIVDILRPWSAATTITCTTWRKPTVANPTVHPRSGDPATRSVLSVGEWKELRSYGYPMVSLLNGEPRSYELS